MLQRLSYNMVPLQVSLSRALQSWLVLVCMAIPFISSDVTLPFSIIGVPYVFVCRWCRLPRRPLLLIPQSWVLCTCTRHWTGSRTRKSSKTIRSCFSEHTDTHTHMHMRTHTHTHTHRHTHTLFIIRSFLILVWACRPLATWECLFSSDTPQDYLAPSPLFFSSLQRCQRTLEVSSGLRPSHSLCELYCLSWPRLCFILFILYKKTHTPFDGTKQQGSDKTNRMAGVGARPGAALPTIRSRLHCDPSAPGGMHCSTATHCMFASCSADAGIALHAQLLSAAVYSKLGIVIVLRYGMMMIML